jgi:hypothetical protein
VGEAPKPLLHNDFSRPPISRLGQTDECACSIYGAREQGHHRRIPMSNGAHQKLGAKVMNSLSGKRSTIFTAFALALGITAGFVYFAPTLANEQLQVSAPATETDVGSMSASRKVRCIMPPAWRRDCGE